MDNMINLIKTFSGFFLVLALISWKADKSGPWVTTKGNRITLHTRPLNHSKTPSPDSLVIKQIISEQEEVIDYVNQKLKTNFNGPVEIFLYNYDEAKEKIGTNGGGFASMNGRQLFFTFYAQPVFNTLRNREEYVGVHEMVHIVTLNTLGNITTSFFGEGYANALDGNYGSRIENNRMFRQRNDSTVARMKLRGRLLTPSELLYNDSIPPRAFYPQIGCLVSWLFDTYGVEKINKLYSVKRKKIEKQFPEVTGERFAEMERRYMEYQATNSH